MVGTTYHFNTTTYPSFFIKNIELNDINSPDYLKGKSVAINSNFFNQTKIYLKQTDKKNYKKMILKVYGQPDNSHFVELKLEKLQLPSKTVFDTKELQVNFITNNTSELYVTGNISQDINLTGSLSILKPQYRLINKSPNQHPIGALVPYFTNKNIYFYFNLNGPFSAPSASINTNIAELMALAKDSILNEKIAEFENKKTKKIKELKAKQALKINNKRNQLKDTYTQAEVALKFQYNNLTDKADTLTREISQKKVVLENSVKSNIENQIKKIKIN